MSCPLIKIDYIVEINTIKEESLTTDKPKKGKVLEGVICVEGGLVKVLFDTWASVTTAHNPCTNKEIMRWKSVPGSYGQSLG